MNLSRFFFQILLTLSNACDLLIERF